MPPPPSRRAPCPCGSGQRYKDCHGAIATHPSPGATAEALLRERARQEWMAGDAAAAVATCRALLQRAAGDIGAWILLGEILRASDGVAAEAAWREALVLDPTHPEANFHLGNALRKRGQTAAAIECYRQALRRAPAHADTLNNLGLALEASGRRDGAQTCYRDALAIEPRHREASGNLARMLFEGERFAASVAAYHRLAAISSELPPAAWVQRAMAQQACGDRIAAEVSFRNAARQAPDNAAIQRNIGTVCSELHRYEDAETAWLRALELEPGDLYALSMLAHARQQRCDWRGLAPIFADINQALEAEVGERSVRGHPSPFSTLSMPTSLRARLHAARLWASGFAPRRPQPAAVVAPAPGERLRVGFVSSDFGEHAMSLLWLECWERMREGRVETFAYAIRTPDPGPTGARVVRAFAHFVDVSGASTAEIVNRIRVDRIAILIDLNGYTRNARPGIFALRPAPVQVNSIGFPGSLAADWYDYIHVDRFVVPETLRAGYSERLLQLPESFYPSDTTRAPTRGPLPRSAYGLPERGFVFACFNNAYKMLPETYTCWMRLLQATPGSVLWLLQSNAAIESNLRREAAHRGVNPQRLIFAARVPVEEHVARNAAADLMLDTFPYGAHTTANDALLAGLPVLTCAGETLTSRIAGSQLHAIGLPELVTTSLDAYEALAQDLARHPHALHGLRMRLAANRHTHPLFDMARYAREFADALERVWADHAGSAPL